MLYKVTDYCRVIPDYPQEGINFYDLNSVFASTTWNSMVENIARRLERDSDINGPTHVVGVESRGFVYGAALAVELGLPFVMIRKANSKHPGVVRSQSYTLEYGTNTIELQEGILGHTSRVIIADDLVATGGSLNASQKLCESVGAKVLANTALIDLVYIDTPEKKELKNLICMERILPLIAVDESVPEALEVKKPSAIDAMKHLDSLDQHGWE